MSWLIVVVVLVALAVLAVVFLPRMQSDRLRRRFGPEYERVLEEEEGDRRRAEKVLRERMSRRAALELRPLDADTVSAYHGRWQEVQLSFVDDPAGAVVEGHELVREVMRDRGYPADGFAQRVEMVSVERPDLAGNYRAACAVEIDGESGRASLDDQRRAFQAYRTLFAHVMGEPSEWMPARPNGAPEAEVTEDEAREDERVEGTAR